MKREKKIFYIKGRLKEKKKARIEREKESFVVPQLWRDWGAKRLGLTAEQRRASGEENPRTDREDCSAPKISPLRPEGEESQSRRSKSAKLQKKNFD